MDVYDYIVVGAGSAGCVVARRLTDDPNVRVLLLEAGGEAKGFWNRTPAGMAMMHKHPVFNWNYFTEPEPHLRGRKIYWPRGKALGGSSAINGMVFVRGHRKDFDEWAKSGNAGWGWDDVLKYFKRSENNDRGDNAFHSTKGPVGVSEPAVIHPTVLDFIEASRRCGIEPRDDLNDGNQEGVGILQLSIKNGIRQSAYDCYIEPIKGRKNLTIKSGVHVRRVLMHDRAAVGVEFQTAAGTQRAFAAREVVLSAGSLSSPHLMLLSGVGPGASLREHGIPVVHDLPGVGQNLQDHFTIRVQTEANKDSSYNRDLRGWRKYREGAKYVFLKNGYLAMGSSSAGAFIKSSPSVDYADLELSFRPMTFTISPAGVYVVDPYDAISASVYRVRPASRGHLALKSADPFEPPAFHGNYLSHPDDVAATANGIRKLREIFAQQPLAARLGKELAPGKDAVSDESLLDYMEREGACAFHPAGTCKMGNDGMAVVDHRLSVRGIERLRVIDASIMPIVASGNTNAATIMIGEKGADLIRDDALAARPGDVLQRGDRAAA